MQRNIQKWLEELGLGRYIDVFIKNDVDFRAISALTEDDLKELGVSLGHRRVLQKAIAALTGDHEQLTHEITPEPISETDTSVAAWERRPGERKPVTMLFADITDSTALTEKLDAEETHDLLYGAIQRICEAVESNQGTVCRFMGDGVMAMFGAPVASEHHAVDACKAALEMQMAVEIYAADLATRYGSVINIRVGLNSGEVIVLTVGEGDKIEYDASGPTVPIAARMEQIAQPGEVYLTAGTRSLAGHRIETVALKPVSVKGISEPISVFALRRVKSTEEAVIGIHRTPFVGRRAELNQLSSMLDICIDDGHGQTIYVRGEPGIGKTRLVEEFSRIGIRKGFATHRGLVLPFGIGVGQDAIRALVGSLLDIPTGCGNAEKRSTAEASLRDGRLEPDQAVFLNDLLDLPQATNHKALYDAMDNTLRNAGKQAVVSRLVTTTSQRRPMLAIIEDVHWADGLTLAHLSTLTKAVADCPALLVMTSRVEGDQIDRQWLSGTEGSPLFTIDLGPLRKQDSITLIGKFMDTDDVLAERCLERAAGNPLFLEQLLLNAQVGTGDKLPDSIQSLVLARMDRLKLKDKRALQAASIIGHSFYPAALSYLLNMSDYNCSELVEHSLVRSEGEGYLFVHALIQESVYASLLKAQRQELHQKAADWFKDKDLILRAQHLDYANDDQAADAYLSAAREQAKEYRFERALGLAKRGLEIAPESTGFALRDLTGELLRTLGSVPESIDVYRLALNTSVEQTERCKAYIGLAEGLRITEQYHDMLEVLNQAEVIASTLRLSVDLARIHRLRGGVCFMRGEFDACLREHTASLGHARDAKSAELEAQALSGLGDAEYARAHMISAHDYYDQCIKLSRRHGFGRIVAANLGMLGKVHCYRLEFNAMLRDIRAALELTRKVCNQRAEMVILEAGTYLADIGNMTEGKAWLEARLNIARQLGASAFESSALAHLGSVAVKEGRQAEGEELAQKAIDTLQHSYSSLRFWGPYALGTLALATNDPDQRRLALEQGEGLLRGDYLSLNYLWFYRDAMEVSLRTEAWGEVERYAMALEDYTRTEPLPWSDFYIARGRTLAAFGRGQHDDATMQELQRLHDEAEYVGLKVAIPALQGALSSN